MVTLFKVKRQVTGLEDNTKSFGNLIEEKIKSFNGMVSRKGGRHLIGWLKQSVLGVVDGHLGSYIGAIASFAFWFNRLRLGRGIKGVVLHMKTAQVLLMQSIGGDRVDDLTALKVRVNRSRSGLPRIIPVPHRRRIMAGDRTVIRFWNTLFGVYRILEFPGALKTNTITDAATSVLSLRRLQDVSTFIPIFWARIFKFLSKDRFLSVLNGQPKFFAISKSGPQTGPLSDENLSYISSSWDAVWRSVHVFLLKKHDAVRDNLFQYALSTGKLIFGHLFNEVSQIPYSGIFQREREVLYLGDKLPVDYDSVVNIKYWENGQVNKDQVPKIWILIGKDGQLKEVQRSIQKEKSFGKDIFITKDKNPPLDRSGLQLDKSFILLVHGKRHWYYYKAVVKKMIIPVKLPISNDVLGKLGTKIEPAGKVRVFAMVDAWTQWLLWPLHKAIQEILRVIPQDGTFNQVGPILELIRAWEAKEIDQTSNVYSFDLSAATDRLPVSLQESLLSNVLGEGPADNWRRLLVERDYALNMGSGVILNLRYSVGQPMGALSSWVMLALTHHFIVQFAYYLVCKDRNTPWTWYTLYAVLGDDMVVIGKSVAAKYLVIMRWLGVGIGLAKSIKARKRLVLEFAKKFFVDGIDCSMVSLRDIIVTMSSTAVASEFMRKHGYSLNAYLTLRGLGFKTRGSVTGRLWALGQRLRVFLVFLSYPGNFLGKQGKLQYTEWMSMYNINTQHPNMDWERAADYLWKVWVTKYLQNKLHAAPGTGSPPPPKKVSGMREEMSRTLAANWTWEKFPQGMYSHPMSYVYNSKAFIELISCFMFIFFWVLSLIILVTSFKWVPYRSWKDTMEHVTEAMRHGTEDYVVHGWFYKLVGKINEFYGWTATYHAETSRARMEARVALVIMTLEERAIRKMPGRKVAEKFVTKETATYKPSDQCLHKDDKNIICHLCIRTVHKRLLTPQLVAERVTPLLKPELFFSPDFLRNQSSDLRFLSLPSRYFCEELWTMMVEMDSNLLTKRISLITEFRTEELMFSSFLPLYTHWKNIQGFSNLGAEPSPTVRRKGQSKALVLYQAPSLALITRDLAKWNAITSMVHVPDATPCNGGGGQEGLTNGHRTRSLISDILFGLSKTLMWPELLSSKVLEWTSTVQRYNRYLGYLVDCLALTMLGSALTLLYLSLGAPCESTQEQVAIQNHATAASGPETAASLDPSSYWYYGSRLAGALVIGAAMYYLGLYMHDAYITTLNYTDPSIRPLFLPAYAEVREVIPLGIGREEIISIFEPRNFGNQPTTPITPASPSFAHGFWE